MGRGKSLDAHTVEKPRSVGRDVGRLVSPVIKIVVAEQADVGHEDPRVHIHPVQYVEVISAVRFRYVAVSVGKIPLTVSHAGVVSRSRDRIHTELGHEPRSHVVVMEISTDTQLLELHLTRSKEFARSTNRVIGRMIEVGYVVDVRAYFRRKKLRVPK